MTTDLPHILQLRSERRRAVSARDDYPELHRQARHAMTPSGYVLKVGGECEIALDEIDHLRECVEAARPLVDVLACDHQPRLGVDVDPECARCKSMAHVRRLFEAEVVAP